MSPYRKFDNHLLEKRTLSSLSALLLEQITGGIYLYSRKKQKVLFYNKEFENLTEIRGTEYRKRGLQPFLELFSVDDFAMIQTKAYPFIVEILSKKKGKEYSVFKYAMNYRLKMPSGKIKHLFHQSTVLELTPTNEPEVILSHISDISEFKKDPAMQLIVSAYDAGKKKWKKLAEERFVYLPKSLSTRETSIMCMLVSGQSQHDIARKLHISYFTVRAHCRHILEKTNCRSIKDLKQKCLEEGWT